jgi:hypothetical protein
MCEMSDICANFDLFAVKPLIKTFQLSFFVLFLLFFFLKNLIIIFKNWGGERGGGD